MGSAYFNAKSPHRIEKSHFNILLDSHSKYDLRDTISEDSRTKTYHAWDNELSRLVICVCLKKRVGEKGAREFLLHARMLGQLKHPGLLPIHDMGVMKNNYFYCYRPAPGKTLYSIMRGGSKEHQLEAKSKQLILILNQVADTVAYLHEQGVTLGKLDLETVSIGRYGEVIITDWTKSKKHDPNKERELLNIHIQDDLKLLSSFGLSLWFLDAKLSNLTIREWDSTARNLPLELQIVFDRAHLGRGGIYKTARSFQADINNYFIGKAPISESNDLGFYIKGKFHSHRKAFILSFCLFMACAVILLTQLNPLTKLEDDLIELQLQHNVQTVELDPINEELKELKESFQRDREEQKHLEERLNVLKQRTKESNEETEILKKEKLTLEKEFKEKNQLLKNKKTEWGDLSIEEEALLKKVTQARLENPDTSIDVPKFNWVDISEILQHKGPKSKILASLKNYAQTLDDQKSWFYEYLNNTDQPSELAQMIDFEFSDTPHRMSPDGQKVLWIGKTSLIILKLTTEPSWQVIHLEDDVTVLDAVFESNSNYIQLLSKGNDINKVYRVNIYNRTPGWSRPYPWPKDFKNLLAYSPSHDFKVRSFNSPNEYCSSELQEADEDSPLEFESELKTLSEKIDYFVVSKQGDAFRKVGNALFSSTLGPHYLDLPKDLISVNFTSLDKSIYTLTKTYLEVFNPAPNTIAFGGNVMSQKNQLLSLGKWTFPKGLTPLSFTASPDASTYWVQLSDQKIYKWELTANRGIAQPLLKGSPILANEDKLLTVFNKSLFYYQLNEKLPTEIFKISSLSANDDVFFDEEEGAFGQSIGKTWSLENDPYYLSISEGDIEVWHRLKRAKVAIIAHSPRPLSKVAYSNDDKRIYALDDRGELLTF